MSDRRVSKEELEAFWRGDKDTYQRMYSQRMLQKANQAEQQGKQVTYIPNDGSGILPEVVATAPKETEELKQVRLKQDYENLTDNAITVAGFIPGLGDAVDAIDTYNEFRQGNYGWGLVGLASFGIPFIPFKSIKNFGRKSYKWFTAPKRSKELTQKIANHYDNSQIIASKIAGRKYLEFIPVTEDTKLKVRESLESKMWDDAKYETAHYHRTPNGDYILTPQELINLRNSLEYPNYIKFAQDNNLDPENLNTAVLFYNLLGTVTRGVFVPDSKRKVYDISDEDYPAFTMEDDNISYSLKNENELGIPWLTEANVSLTGGDRLGVNSGLYVSNSYDMADRYSRLGGNMAKNDETGTSFKAIMQDNRPSLTQEDIDLGIEHILNKSESFGLPLQVKQILGHDTNYNDGLLFIEETFRENPLYKERAYFGNPGEKIVDIKNLLSSNKTEDIIDIHGRWGNNINPKNEDKRLFYPTIINLPYINRLLDRITLFSQKNPEFTTEFMQLLANFRKNNKVRFNKAFEIRKKLGERLVLAENIATGTGITSGLGLLGYGGYEGYKYIMDKSKEKNLNAYRKHGSFLNYLKTNNLDMSNMNYWDRMKVRNAYYELKGGKL